MQYLCAKVSFNVKVVKVLRLGLTVKVGDDIVNKKILVFGFSLTQV